jgi:hypothetical protein
MRRTHFNGRAMGLIIAILILSTGLSGMLNAQEHKTLPDVIQDNLKEQLILYPQEKVYLQNDRPTYITGEKIWFRTYSVYATTHEPADWSRYVYVELIGEKGK